MADMDRPTLLDVARETDPNGQPAQVVEVLTKMCPMLADGPAFASNAPMGNKVTRRSSLPSVAWTRVNQGVARSKGQTTQVTDTIGILSGLSEVDDKLKFGISDAQFAAKRWNEDQGFLEAFAQELELSALYGNELTNDAAFTGVQPRLQTKATAKTGSQVRAYKAIVAGQTDISSIYVIDWGLRGVHFIFPPSSTAGIQVDNLGKIPVEDADGKRLMAWCTQYDWAIGLSVADPRHMARLCNIDVSVANADTGFELGLGLIDVLTSMPKPMGMRRVIYCSTNVEAAFRKQALAKSNAALSMADYLGELTPHFYGYPIRTSDQLSETETEVT